MLKNLKQLDFSLIKKHKECALKAVLMLVVFSYFFYHSFLAVPFIFPIMLFYLAHLIEIEEEKEQWKLTLAFSEFLESLCANLQAGYSMENAIFEVKTDMMQLYGEKHSIVLACNEMMKGIRNQISIEEIMFEFGEKSGVQEIIDFATVFGIAKRTGGNMIEIIKQTKLIISEKCKVQDEIHTLIAAKLFETDFMNIVPFAICLYVSATSKGFFDCMYGNINGVVIMTIGLIIYIASYVISQKIIHIRV